MPKLRFLPSAMHTQDRACVRRVLHAYVGWDLRKHKLKNRYMHARISLHMHQSRLHTQEQVCACRPKPTYVGMNTEGCSLTFFKFSQPKLNQNMFLPLLEYQVFI